MIDGLLLRNPYDHVGWESRQNVWVAGGLASYLAFEASRDPPPSLLINYIASSLLLRFSPTRTPFFSWFKFLLPIRRRLYCSYWFPALRKKNESEFNWVHDTRTTFEHYPILEVSWRWTVRLRLSDLPLKSTSRIDCKKLELDPCVSRVAISLMYRKKFQIFIVHINKKQT